MNRLYVVAAFFVITGSLVGCSSDSSSSDEVVDVSGTIEVAAGATLPPTGDVSILWSVQTGSPDYVYAFGRGSSVDAQFSVSMLSAPPVEALNDGVGVGFLFLMPAGSGLPEGRMSYDLEGGSLAPTEEAAPWDGALGAAARYAIVYKAADADTYDLSWADAFPSGYSCAVEVPGQDGGADSFTPVDCTALEIQVDSLENIELTNWS